MKTLIFLATFASVTLYLPNAGQTVLGAATTTARVGDTVRVGVFVDQADAGLTELFLAVPYNPSVLEYTGVEGTGLTAVNVKATATQGSVNLTWKGTLAAGEARHLGYALFRVSKADKSTFQATGVNPTAKDSAGTLLTDIQVLASEATVQLSPRPLRVQMDLAVQ